MKKQELNYYDEFIKNVEIALQMSTILKEYSNEFDYDKSETNEIRVHKLENDADQNLHMILNYLIKDFLPPIEREDIVMLANKIDDVIDNIDEIVINLDILDVKKLREDFKDFTNLIYEICLKQKELMTKFKNINKYEEIEEMVVYINKLEEMGDRLYENAIRDLYRNENNAIEISKWHRIYDCLENCFDSCESVAVCVEEIMMKNS